MTLKATPHLITIEWREEVRKRLKDLKISQAELARRVPCSAPTITEILRTQTQTEHLPRINKILGIGSPMAQRAWEDVGRRANAAGYIEAMNEWAELGERLHKLGDLAELTEMIRDKVKAAELLEASNDRLSVPLRIVRQDASDPPAKTSTHGASKSRERRR